MNALKVMLFGIVTVLMFGCSQAHMRPHTALGDDLTLVELSHYAHFFGQQPVSRIDAHLTAEEVKEVEEILGKPFTERSLHYFHLRKKRSVLGRHGIYFTTDADTIKALVFVQRNRIDKIEVIKDGDIYRGNEYAIFDRLKRMSVYDLKTLPYREDYREASREVRDLIDQLTVAMAFLEVIHKES